MALRATCSRRSRIMFSKPCEGKWDFFKGNLDELRESSRCRVCTVRAGSSTTGNEESSKIFTNSQYLENHLTLWSVCKHGRWDPWAKLKSKTHLKYHIWNYCRPWGASFCFVNFETNSETKPWNHYDKNSWTFCNGQVGVIFCFWKAWSLSFCKKKTQNQLWLCG